ncbi:MAG TPA: hypothetical protein VMU53_02000 [Candidatus Sulfotelmatobacter sp.]|nr:hypothetical protein [Candidatus Sulfotelmatobacter sp.]
MNDLIDIRDALKEEIRPDPVKVLEAEQDRRIEAIDARIKELQQRAEAERNITPPLPSSTQPTWRSKWGYDQFGPCKDGQA